MNIHFRKAETKDAPEIERLYQALVNDPNIHVSGETIEALKSDETNLLIVGECDGLAVATAFLVICRDVMYGDQPFALVENIVVDPSARKQGVGRALMDHLKSICKGRKCTKIMLLSSAARSEAHAFFESCGGDKKKGFVNYINR